jgi:hypothetical protein
MQRKKGIKRFLTDLSSQKPQQLVESSIEREREREREKFIDNQ